MDMVNLIDLAPKNLSPVLNVFHDIVLNCNALFIFPLAELLSLVLFEFRLFRHLNNDPFDFPNTISDFLHYIIYPLKLF